MANPEHLKIVKDWKETKDSWLLEHLADPLDLSGTDLRGIFLQRASLINANLEDTNFEGANLLRSDFSMASLKNANLKKAILVKAIFDNAYMHNASLESAECREALFRHTNMMFATLKGADLSYANFDDTDFRGADLTDSDVSLALFLGTKLHNSTLSGIKFSTLITEGWVIDGVICTHFFTDKEFDFDARHIVWKRIPKVGNLVPGEFEDRFKMRPTIEYLFESGMPALGPAILALAVDQVNSQRPDTGLRLIEISTRGGLPRGIIEIAEKISKADALTLVSSCYQQKVAQMQKEIEALNEDKQAFLKVISQKMLLPAMQIDGDSWITITEAADLLAVNPGVISRWADEGRIKDNGKNRRDRRVLKTSVLLIKQNKEDAELLKDAKDLRKDSKKFH
ncbi:MAG: pentapeptide repeat-containing protein [Promethearchaeota archaeon]